MPLLIPVKLLDLWKIGLSLNLLFKIFFENDKLSLFICFADLLPYLLSMYVIPQKNADYLLKFAQPLKRNLFFNPLSRLRYC